MGDDTGCSWSPRGVLVQTESFVRFAASGRREESVCGNKGTGRRPLLSLTHRARVLQSGFSSVARAALHPLSRRFLLCAIGVLTGRGLVCSDTRHRGNGLRVQSSTGKQGLNPHPPIRPCRFWGFGNVSRVDKGTTALYFDSRLHKLSLRAFPVPPDVTPFPRFLPQRTVC